MKTIALFISLFWSVFTMISDRRINCISVFIFKKNAPKLLPVTNICYKISPAVLKITQKRQIGGILFHFNFIFTYWFRTSLSLDTNCYIFLFVRMCYTVHSAPLSKPWSFSWTFVYRIMIYAKSVNFLRLQLDAFDSY